MDAQTVARLIEEHYDDGRHALYEALVTALKEHQ